MGSVAAGKPLADRPRVGGVSDQPTSHLNRKRAGSFGSIAADYDRFRPPFPDHAVDTVVHLAAGGHVVDVGAGTGIFTAQLRGRGVAVSAVEPDDAMGAVARGKGLAVTQASFEGWDGPLRRPAVLVFANAWHWVDPVAAIPKAAAILASGGYLVLLWHALVPTGAAAAAIDAVYERHQLSTAQPAPSRPDTSALAGAGFTVTVDSRVVEATWETDAWIGQQFTVSSHVVLGAAASQRLRDDLADAIGPAGVTLAEVSHVVIAQR